MACPILRVHQRPVRSGNRVEASCPLIRPRQWFGPAVRRNGLRPSQTLHEHPARRMPPDVSLPFWGMPPDAKPPPPPLCDIPSGCCCFMGPWTVTRSSLRMLRWVAAFCRPLRPVLLLVSFPRSRSPVVGVPGLWWMWHGVPFACQRRPIIGVLRMCWLLPGSFDCFCCPHTSVHRPSIACLAVFLCGPGALFIHALSGPSTTPTCPPSRQPSRPGLAPYPAATAHGLTTKRGRGGGRAEVQEKAQGEKKMLFAQVSLVHISFAGCRSPILPDAAGCEPSPLPEAARRNEKFCRMLGRSLVPWVMLLLTSLLMLCCCRCTAGASFALSQYRTTTGTRRTEGRAGQEAQSARLRLRRRREHRGTVRAPVPTQRDEASHGGGGGT